MRFSEKLKFFVFGGCFVVLGVALTYLTGIKASDEKDFGVIKQFDTIWCKTIAIVDDDDNPRIYLSTSRDLPTILMMDSNRETTFMVTENDEYFSASMIIGDLETVYTKITPDGVVKRVNEKVVSEWP